MWNDFFYYRRSERIAVLILLAAIGIGLVWLRWFSPQPTSPMTSLAADTSFIQTCDSFYLTLVKESRYTPRATAPKPVLAPFDPNLADSARFVRMGLAPWVARNIVKYRNKGGRFFRPEQFARIYGIDSMQFQLLLPYIQIDTSRLAKRFLRYERDTSAVAYPVKFTELTRIELNRADTSLLMKIPGIGSGFAAMVVGYRNRLGGFYAVDQLREIRGVNDSLFSQWKAWFYVDNSVIKPIQVNEAGITRLRNHPYLNFYQAKVIVELKREYKKLRSMEELSLLEEFSATDLERLRYYLNFD